MSYTFAISICSNESINVKTNKMKDSRAILIAVFILFRTPICIGFRNSISLNGIFYDNRNITIAKTV